MKIPVVPDNAVLLPIDMQQAFDSAPWPRRWNADIDRNGLTLLVAWRGAGRPPRYVVPGPRQPQEPFGGREYAAGPAAEG